MSQTPSENCLRQVRAHIQDLGDDPVPLSDVKLMVLGNGRIGKTQICNRLRGRAFEEDADSTHGVTLGLAPLPDGSGKFNLWDFGGQDIYHGTHALFLKSRAIFLLVWTPETDNAEETEHGGMSFRNRPVSWWVDFIAGFGMGKTPLIVVQNQLDREGDRGEHPEVAARRPDLAFCKSLAYSALNEDGSGALQDYLKQAVRQVNPPLIGRGRLTVIERLRALRREDESREADARLHRTISVDHFIRICEEAGGVSDPRLFLSFLHNAGEVFWNDALFEEQVILDQAWVLDAIYTIFNRDKCFRELKHGRGRFGRETLAALVWDAEGYSAAEQELFLSFMVEAGICFRISEYEGEARYIAPDLLPEDHEGRALFDDLSGGVHASIAFPLLPPMLMRHVIARIGAHAGLSCEYWRHGFMGYDRETNARIRVEQSLEADGSGMVDIAAKGRQPEPLLGRMQEIVHEEAARLGLEAETPAEKLTGGPAKVPDFAPDPQSPAEYYVSYAWADDDDPKRDEIVDRFCERAKARGIHVHRDRDELRTGDRISEFMARLVEGDRVLVVLSDKYLRSEPCMSELHGIWRLTSGNTERFREKVRVFTVKDTKIWDRPDRARVARQWREKYEAEKDHVEDMGGRDRTQHFRLKQFAADVGDILSHVADVLQPRTLDDLEAYAFDDHEGDGGSV